MANTVWCFGRSFKPNNPKELITFLKPYGCLVQEKALELPSVKGTLLAEIEVAAKIGSDLQIESLGLALDITLLEAQEEVMRDGKPWLVAKGFKGSCPIHGWVPIQSISSLDDVSFSVLLNNQTLQKGILSDLSTPFSQMIENLKALYPLREGDIVLSGAPSHGFPLTRGMHLEGRMNDQLEVSWKY